MNFASATTSPEKSPTSCLRAHILPRVHRRDGSIPRKKSGHRPEASIVYRHGRLSFPFFARRSATARQDLGSWRTRSRAPTARRSRSDSAADFRELTTIKIKSKDTGLVMVGGRRSQELRAGRRRCRQFFSGHEAPMHKYAIQVTVADVRDGALSSSTLKEASSWGKVDTAYETDGLQRSHARRALDRRLRPYHKNHWTGRGARRWSASFDAQTSGFRLVSSRKC